MPQVRPGGVVSTVVTFWEQVWLLPQPSVIVKVRWITSEHAFWLRTVSEDVTVTPQQDERMTGESKLQPVPHSTVLLVGQTTVSGGAGMGDCTTKETAQL